MTCNACNDTRQIIDQDGQRHACPFCPPARKRNKYNAEVTFSHGHRFDSKAEARRYDDLCLLTAAGDITDLEVHPRFLLLDSFTDSDGNKVRAVNYTADFAYTDKGGRQIVEDVKGGKATRTEAFVLRSKMFRRRYPEKHLRIVTR